MRINIYKQIRAFYSKVFNDEFELSPTHISLYMFLLNQNNRTNWTEWFKVPFDTVMHGAAINSNKTYYKALNYLAECGLIKYEKGSNNYKAPRISIIPLNQEDNNVPAPEQDHTSSVANTPLTTHQLTLLTTQLNKQQTTQLDKQLSKQLSKHKDILVTGNFVITKKEGNNTAKSEKQKPREDSGPTYLTDEEMGDLKAVWLDYLQHRQEQNLKPYKSHNSEKIKFNQLLKLSNNKPRMAQGIVNQSRANNWQGLFELKDNSYLEATKPSKSNYRIKDA
jgi:hypothetical protein